MGGLFDPRIISKEFALPDYILPTALLILGYPNEVFLDANRHLTQRKPIDETVMFEKYME